jgi:hypothetical protein
VLASRISRIVVEERRGRRITTSLACACLFSESFVIVHLQRR